MESGKPAVCNGITIGHDIAVVRSPFYWGLALLSVFFVCQPLFLSTPWSAGGLIGLYCILLYFTYGIMYLLPTWLLSRLAAGFAGRFPILIRIIAVGGVGVTLIFLYADALIHKIYGYHINGFVLNLITTPGGIESMGGSGKTTLYFVLIAAGFISIPAVAYYLGLRRAAKSALSVQAGHNRRSFRWLPIFLVFLFLTACERLTFSVASLFDWDSVLQGAEAFPLYQPVTVRHLVRKMGFDIRPKREFAARIKGGGISYPLKPLELAPLERPYNIVWLVAESWRWDMLNPEIMPATWAFARQGQRFTNHHSGGDGTRMALFSMFYSLHGATWFKMLNANKGPLIMDAIEGQGYQ